MLLRMNASEFDFVMRCYVDGIKMDKTVVPKHRRSTIRGVRIDTITIRSYVFGLLEVTG